jgi:hypothetical protein
MIRMSSECAVSVLLVERFRFRVIGLVLMVPHVVSLARCFMHEIEFIRPFFQI